MNSLERITAYLSARRIPFEIIAHPPSATSRQTAHAAGVDGHRLVKTVLLEAPDGYLAAMIPADEQIRLGRLRKAYGREFSLAPEATVRALFDGCEAGAVPGLPMLWNVGTLWDEDLLSGPDLYLEAGDHRCLVRVRTQDLMAVLADLPHGHFGRPHTWH